MFDLKDNAPDKVLHQLFLNLEKLKREGDSLASEIQKNLRIIVSLFDVISFYKCCFFGAFVYEQCCVYQVAGGDGTAGWILGVISDLNLTPPPPVATVPLGTGNNLPFAVGWVRWGPQICGT